MNRVEKRRTSASGSVLLVHADRIVKFAVTDASAEAAAVRALHDLSVGASFRSPAILEVDEAHGCFAMERLDLGEPLLGFVRRAVSGGRADRDAAVEAFESAGRALGEVHRATVTAADGAGPCPGELAGYVPVELAGRLVTEAEGRGVVWLHGDFGTTNVFVDPAGAVTVIDPLPNGYSSFEPGGVGSRYLDLAVMESCLVGRGSSAMLAAASRRRMRPLRRAFRRGYEQAVGFALDAALLHRTTRAVLESYLVHRRGLPERSASLLARGVCLRAGAAEDSRSSTAYEPAASGSYGRSHIDPGYGVFYDRTINAGYYGDVWLRQERPILERWLAAERERGASSALDFACGTGRITAVLAEWIPRTLGVDVSDEMLAVARRTVPRAEFERRDVTTGDTEIDPVDVATAFRFFMNAEADLRERAMAALSRRVRPGGAVIVSVQCNAAAPSGLLQRARRRWLGHTVTAMSAPELDALLLRHGFVTEETAWIAFCPRPGPYLASAARALQQPMRAAARSLRIPDRRAANMFLVRARRS